LPEHTYKNEKKMYKISPKWTKRQNILPIGRKIYQHPLQDPPKFAQNGIFCFENIPSGNPGDRLSAALTIEM
jgi:5-bromo-4-chloroindolyl phosphate hydrolysis protein